MKSKIVFMIVLIHSMQLEGMFLRVARRFGNAVTVRKMISDFKVTDPKISTLLKKLKECQNQINNLNEAASLCQGNEGHIRVFLGQAYDTKDEILKELKKLGCSI